MIRKIFSKQSFIGRQLNDVERIQSVMLNNGYVEWLESQTLEKNVDNIRVKEISGWSGSQTDSVNEFCGNHKVISVTPIIKDGLNNKYIVVYFVPKSINHTKRKEGY